MSDLEKAGSFLWKLVSVVRKINYVKKQKNPVSMGFSFILILVIIYYFFNLFTYDQSDYLENHKRLQEKESISVTITGFYTFSSPSMFFSRISIGSGYSIGNEMVVRADDDYIGRVIKVKQLPNSDYIRDKFVFTRNARNKLIKWVIVIFLFVVLRGRKKEKK